MRPKSPAKSLSTAEKFYLERIESSYSSIMKVIPTNPDNFRLSPVIALEAVRKFVENKDLIESSHPKMNGTELFKITGYLAYFIAILKPVQILDPDPDNLEVEINEFLAITFALDFFYEKFGICILSGKMVDDLRYSLRYRVLTLRTLPMIFEAYFVGYQDK